MIKRDEIRIDAKEPSTATILGHPDVSIPCEIVNFSKTGMCVIVGQNIPEGQAVKVDWDGHFLVGRVQRVCAVEANYSVGLQLLYCSQWQGAVEPVLAGR